MTTPRAAASSGYAFGTFKGVFTPSLLTILGIVMYLRMGWVLGHLGLPQTLVVVTVANSITLLTALSLAALATNMRVGGGGAYYVISRSLGVETGAAVGLPLFLAQALGIAFYIAGFAESLVQVFPFLDATVVGVVTLLALTAVVSYSASLALQSQFVIMGAIALSLVSFYLGSPDVDNGGARAASSTAALSFWPVFAVFFPAVTGIEAGIAMSGDLKDPARSLPRGTLAAVLVGYVVYLSIPIALHLRGLPRGALVDDPLVMQTSARWGAAVLVGIWAASLSSAMGALLGAPRTLQALARDRVVPAEIGRGYGRHRDPRLALFISVGIGMAGILLGDLNAIAPVLSMFFLTSYGVLNLSAGVEELISNPAWRPTFRVPSWVSLGGFVACLIVMLMIAPGATMLAMATSGAIYWMMKRRSLRAQWGDLRLGIMMYLTRLLLHRMAGRTLDERTWKPNLLVLSGNPQSRWHLIELADAIAQSRSFVTVASIVPEGSWDPTRAEQATEAIRAYLRRRGVPAFIRTLPAPDPYSGAETMIRTYGFGPIVPNTILIGETEKPSSFTRFAELVRTVTRSNRNLVIVRERAEAAHRPDEAPPHGNHRIDLWWAGGMSQHAAFMLALAVLLRRSAAFAGAELRVCTTVPTEAERAEAAERIRRLLEEARVSGTSDALARDGRSPYDLIEERSAGASLVLLEMRPPAADESAAAYATYYEEIIRVTERLPPTALVMASERVDFSRIFEAR